MAKKKTHNKEGNLYDKIFKENAEQLFLPLVEERLQIKIKSFQPLQEKLQTTIEREMDFFYEVLTEEGETFLLHLEFQTENDPDMIYRSAEYHGMAFRRKKLPIKHVLIFLGKGAITMRSQLSGEELFKGFEVVHIHQMNTATFLSSQVPEVILLSILSDIPTDKTEAILRLIIQQLKQVCKNANELSKYLKQLIILSRLRKFDNTAIKIINTMPITYDVETDYLYLQGKQKGESEGIEQGIERGKLKKSILAIRNMLQKDFELSLIAEILSVEKEFITQIQEELKQENFILQRLKKRQQVKTIAKALKVSPLLVEVIKEMNKKKE